MRTKACYWLYILWMCIFTINEIWIIWIWVLFLMMFIDTIAWSYKAFVFNEFNVKKLSRWIGWKLFLLVVLLSIIAVVDYFWYVSWVNDERVIVWVTINLLIWLLIASELISVINKYISCRTWVKQEDHDYITQILSKVLSFFRNKIEDFSNDDKQSE